MSEQLEKWAYPVVKRYFDDLFTATSSQRFLKMNDLENDDVPMKYSASNPYIIPSFFSH